MKPRPGPRAWANSYGSDFFTPDHPFLADAAGSEVGSTKILQKSQNFGISKKKSKIPSKVQRHFGSRLFPTGHRKYPRKGGKKGQNHSPTGNRTRVWWVRATYPDLLDYRGLNED